MRQDIFKPPLRIDAVSLNLKHCILQRRCVTSLRVYVYVNAIQEILHFLQKECSPEGRSIQTLHRARDSEKAFPLIEMRTKSLSANKRVRLSMPAEEVLKGRGLAQNSFIETVGKQKLLYRRKLFH